MNKASTCSVFFKCIIITILIQSLLYSPSILCTNKNLKILMVVDSFPHPLQFFILNQITGLIDRGNDVWILANGVRDGKIQEEVINYKLLEKTKYDISQFNLDQFDIIYCQIGDLAPKFAEIKISQKSKWKLVSAFRGFDATKLIKKNPTIYNSLFKVADLLLPVCDFFKSGLVKAGCNSKKITVHHSGIDCRQFTFKPRVKKGKTINIVSVARLYPIKGYEFAIHAIAKLREKKLPIQYTIVGDGYLKKSLYQLIEKLNLAKYVTIVGEKSHDEIAEILNKAHIFLLASTTTHDFVTEGIPNSLMEAMACGLPVVSTYHAGIPELVKDGVSGFLVPEKDILGLANKLEYLVRHPELWPSLGSAGHNYVLKEHNTEVCNDKLARMLRNLFRS